MNLTKKVLWKRIAALLIVLLANLLFFLTVWMSQKYDQVTLDQFIYQAKTSAAGANRSLMKSAYIRVGAYGGVLTLIEVIVFLIFSGSLSGILKKLFKSDKYYRLVTDSKPCSFVIRHVLPLALAVFIFAASFFTVKMNFVDYASGVLTNSTFIEDNYVDPDEVQLTFPEEKRNLIYIFLESLENTFADAQTVGAADAGIAGEDPCSALFPAKHRPLGEYRQAVEGCRAASAYGGICQDPIVEGCIDTVVIPVEGHRLHINVSVKQFRTADLGSGCGVQKGLGACGQIDPQILDAILIPAAVCDLSGVDGEGTAQILRSALQGALAIIRHGDTSRSFSSP